jgi:hypothetical protein
MRKEKLAKASATSCSTALPNQVAAPDYLSIVWRHLTEELCDHVFQATRVKERVRKWSLYVLMKLWIGVLQLDLSSQTEAVEEYCGKGHPLFPLVEASPESFFQRIQTLRPEFFRNLFVGFTASIEKEFPANFQSELPISKDDFPEIYAVDGSRLAKVGRILKVAQKTTKAIIPGSLEAVYDLRRGHLRELYFDPDGARSELHLFDKILPHLQPKALLVNDRYYPKPVIWRKIEEHQLFMVARYNATVKKKKVRELSKIRSSKVNTDDWIVQMGGSQYGTEPVTLRWIHVWDRTFDIILITNVLDPKRLSVDQLLSLYKQRWSVERMYLHLKEVLALNRLFNASPSAISGQVYATAILYNALRLSQAQLASKLKVLPEHISPDKFICRVVAKVTEATIAACYWEAAVERMVEANLGKKLKTVPFDPADHPQLSLSTEGLLLQKRNPKRRKRKFCKGRKRWTTYKKMPGAKKLLQN